MTPADHREFTRIARQVDADAEVPGTVAAGHTRDVSVKGMLLVTATALPAGAMCACTLHLDGRGGQVAARATGVVVRQLAGALAIEFIELVDPESYCLLRDLVLYNAADPTKVEDELSSHLGIKRAVPPTP